MTQDYKIKIENSIETEEILIKLLIKIGNKIIYIGKTLKIT